MKRIQIGERARKWVMSLLLPAFAYSGGPVQANPQGGVVVRGAADIARISSNQLRIHQQSRSVVINWQDFSIDNGDLTRFVQPNNGTALNRVVSGNVSQIHGQLKGNANVYVVNPNGIVIGPNGVIDVAGNAVLSTLDIDDDDFMDGGQNRFYGSTNTGVSNFGTVSSASGDVVLLGGFVENHGQIGALNGNVAIGAGGEILLQEGAGSKISVRGSSDYTGTAITNTGSIRGASAELKSHGNVYALAINNTGAIRATGADRSSGRVLLRASGGSSNINLGSRSTIVANAGADGGTVEVDAGQGQATVAGRIEATGSRSGGSVSVVGNQIVQEASSVINASGGQSGGNVALASTGALSVSGAILADASTGVGGNITTTGESILINDGADLSADGYAAGGKILTGGDFQGRNTGLLEAQTTRVERGASFSADSLTGKGGTVVVWANGDTLFLGEVSASALGGVGNGGLVEVSGLENLYFDGTARVGTVGGKAGTVLFDPGDVVIAATGTTPPIIGSQPTTDSTISIASINDTLQSGANVLIVTGSGNIAFNSVGGGGDVNDGTEANNRHSAIQWTNSLSSFGAFASGSILVNNHIRTTGAGSINLLGGWGGSEGDAALQLDPQSAWDFYVGQGEFGNSGGSVFIGSSSMTRHVEVGSRFGDTNVAGFDVRVTGSDTAANNRYSILGFHDGGQIFAPRLNRGLDGGGIEIRLDMRAGAPGGAGAWLLSDGRNNATLANNQAAAGVGDPIVAVAGQNEVDLNGDGIADGVRGINSTGAVADTFIPYANHFNSVTSGNWWWQQIEAAGSLEVKDPLKLGALRPEYGAGVGSLSTASLALGAAPNGADINVLAKGGVSVAAGAGNEAVGAMIGHGGVNRPIGGGAGHSTREIGNEDITNAAFSITGIEGNQLERRWSFNGSDNDRISTSIGRLAPIYGNINVYAGIDAASTISVNHSSGKVNATVGLGGDVNVRGPQVFDTGAPASNSSAQIGHGGLGQFGEYYGDIHVEAGRSINVLAGEATRATASIGHTFIGHTYWNPTNVADQQLRFFATASDFDNPNLRRGELFSGAVTTGFDPTLDPERLRRYNLTNFPDNGVNAGGFAINTTLGYSVNQYTRAAGGGNANQGIVSLGTLNLAPAGGPITVAALSGSVVSGFHGKIEAFARNGDVNVVGYSTQGVIGAFARDRRYAAIGHGGSTFAYATEGSGYQSILTTPAVPGAGGPTPDGRENVSYRMPNGTGLETGSRSFVGEVGGNMNRHLVFMTITGDIDVIAGGNVTMMAGNDIHDYVRIGHGGTELADYETSSYILGDIRVTAGGDISVIGGGAITPLNRAGDYDVLAPAHIGHGGYRSGFMALLGDIDVNAGGNVLVRNGAYSFTQAKIGHQALEDRAQVGGNFSRSEHFRVDGVQSNIVTTLNASTATVDYSSANAHPNSVVGNRSFTAGQAGTLVGADRNTADITVTAGGGVTVEHMKIGERQPLTRTGAAIGSVTNQGAGVRTRNSYAQIGHGGISTLSFNVLNTATNYQNKIGDITVTANGGNVEVKNGEGQTRWSRIGHGVGRAERVDDSSNVGFSRAIELSGDISVTASGDIRIDALAADENERIENTNSLFGPAAPSEFNPAAIGHGGIENNLDLVVLGRGELMSGLVASSNITAVAGGDMEILGGKGADTSFAQLGHGFSSDLGDDASRRMGVYTGFAGDISVSVDGNLLVEGGPNAWTEQPSGISEDEGRTVTGAFAAIGHGGFQLDAPSFGDITVFVGNDLSIVGQRRTDPFTDTFGASPYTIQNPDTDAIASAFNFAKIGHFSVENGNRQANLNDAVFNANQTGDITVVVGRDLAVLGGTTPDVDNQTIYGAFAQIGHGGPSITGDLNGDITVLVKRNISVVQGSEITTGSLTTRALNNYAMIGNGDFLHDTNSASQGSLFRQTARGIRQGDLIIAAGNNASFNGALIGHLDPALSPQSTFGNTQIAVSRLNPFFGGAGTLTAINNTVITSGGFGNGTRTEFYLPARSNNLMDGTTRINEITATFAEAPANFAAPFNRADETTAGRADEVYLTPDLWWDESGIAAAGNIPGGGVFPTDAISGHGGSVALVNSPGGLANLDSMVAGSLGTSAPLYRDSHGVSGTGLYTIYYDAIEAVSNSLPQQPNEPGISLPFDIFDFFGLAFDETYDPFFRLDELYDGVAGNRYGLYELLGLFERDAETAEESGAWQTENALDNLFGERRDSNTEEEDDEEEESRRARANKGGPVGMPFYVFEPGTNRYSSYRVFGNQISSFYPAN